MQCCAGACKQASFPLNLRNFTLSRANDNLISISRLLGESQLTHQKPMALPFAHTFNYGAWLLRSLMDIIVFNYFIIRLPLRRKIDNNDKEEETTTSGRVLHGSVPFSWVHTQLIAKALRPPSISPDDNQADPTENYGRRDKRT